jgi:hypothetical protein
MKCTEFRKQEYTKYNALIMQNAIENAARTIFIITRTFRIFPFTKTQRDRFSLTRYKEGDGFGFVNLIKMLSNKNRD